MKITRINPVTLQPTEREIPIETWQADAIFRGEDVKTVAPDLNGDDEAFIKFGMLPGDWDTLYGPEKAHLNERFKEVFKP